MYNNSSQVHARSEKQPIISTPLILATAALTFGLALIININVGTTKIENNPQIIKTEKQITIEKNQLNKAIEDMQQQQIRQFQLDTKDTVGSVFDNCEESIQYNIEGTELALDGYLELIKKYKK